MTDVMLQSSRGTVVFGPGPFLLHRLDPGGAALQGAEVGRRHIALTGYILPDGETEQVRAAEMEAARRLICRTVSDPDGFRLRIDGREILLTAEKAPAFSFEAPLNGADAASFTVEAMSREEDGCFTGKECIGSVQSQHGMLVFPLAVTEEMLFGTQAQSGTLTAINPGDVPAGFVLTVTAQGGRVESFTVSCGGEFLRVTHMLAEGESLQVDTRTGHKDVTAGGNSVLSDTDWRSSFFALLPGENTLRWSCEGTGYPSLTLALTPRYL